MALPVTKKAFSGVVLSYKLSKHLKVFADYSRLYNGKGFSGRAKIKNTHADLAIIGVSYAF